MGIVALGWCSIGRWSIGRGEHGGGSIGRVEHWEGWSIRGSIVVVLTISFVALLFYESILITKFPHCDTSFRSVYISHVTSLLY